MMNCLGTTTVLANRWKTCCFAVAKVLFAVGCLAPAQRCEAQDFPFTVPDGFSVTRVADDALAHDCFCMTLDASGRPVISGPGYLKTLVDENGDGVYDRGVAWTEGIKQGAQGLWSDGKILYWVTDGGLWRAEDSNGDLVADRSPTRVLELPTGGEHDAHAIRRGPDGYWYLVVGNFASAIGQLANDNTAAVTRARAGTLWRISPDFSRRGVWAHGLRNCYDFDFMPDGQIVTYDSDDEREATLPWYRPTRVMVLGPGSDGGWCGPAWKDDDYRLTMPLVLARLGRGSPTGVAVYQHRAFPRKYHDAVFVLDWTFGRVIAVHPSANLDASERVPGKIPSEIFMQPSGTAGFAPTDICVAPDGSLLICVGGRGTTGAVYRVATAQAVAAQSTADQAPIAQPAADAAVAATDPTDPNAVDSALAERLSWFAPAGNKPPLAKDVLESIIAVLDAPCPWDAWSESSWRPLTNAAVIDGLAKIITGQLPVQGPADQVAQWKLRAAQVLTRVGAKVAPDAVARSLASPASGSRAAAWWLAGRMNMPLAEEQRLQRGIKLPAPELANEACHWDAHLGPSDQRLQWEALGLKRWSCAEATRCEATDDLAGNALRRTWLWALSRSSTPPAKKELALKLDGQMAKLFFGPAKNGIDTAVLETLGQWLSAMREKLSTREQLEVLATMQASLGDRRWTLPLQSEVIADALDGYRGSYASRMNDSVRNSWARWALHFAQIAESKGQQILHAEALRTMAMFEPNDPACVEYLLSQIDEASHPTSDIHMLCCMAQCGAPREPDTTTKTANTLAEIVRKVKSRGLYTDNQWPNRLQQLVTALTRKDARLGTAFVELPTPCCNEDLVLINAFPSEVQSSARKKMRDHLLESPAKEWTVPILKYSISGDMDNDLRDAVRKAASVESLRSACMDVLSAKPSQDEYDLFLAAIEQGDRTLWPSAWRGIASLTPSEPEREWPTMAKLVSASLNTSVPLPRPAVLKRAREVATQSSRPSPPASDSWSDWDAYLKLHLAEDQYSGLVAPTVQIDANAVLKSIEGLRGDVASGKTIYAAKCGLCHGGQSSLGPSLSGVAKRFSRLDLARAIVEPSRDISDRYRSVRVLTIDDEILTGMIIYNAADGVTLQAADGSILRINQDAIQEKGYSTESLMPNGLLDDKAPQEIADLFAYLGTL